MTTAFASTYAAASDRFNWLQRPLEGWVERVGRYATSWSRRSDARRDAAYWHGERASASVLVAAFAEQGADVLAEYGCERVDEEGSRSRRGRTDFWCQLEGGPAAVVEAKQVWVASPGQIDAQICSSQKDAAHQLLNAAKDVDENTLLLSAVFVVPRVKATAVSSVSDLVAAFVSALADDPVFRSPPAVGCAWCFPDGARDLRGVRNDGFVFPGVFLILRDERLAAVAV